MNGRINTLREFIYKTLT